MLDSMAYEFLDQSLGLSASYSGECSSNSLSHYLFSPESSPLSETIYKAQTQNQIQLTKTLALTLKYKPKTNRVNKIHGNPKVFVGYYILITGYREGDVGEE